MTDAEYEELKAWMEERVDLWHKRLFEGGEHTVIEWDREHSPETHGCAGRCKSDWRYHDNLITFYLPICWNVYKDAPEQLEEIIVHELCHIVAAPLSDHESKHDEEEHMVTQMARAFIRVYAAGDYNARMYLGDALDLATRAEVDWRD